MWLKIAGGLLLVSLLAACLPVTRIRKFALAALHRGGQFVAAAALLGLGFLFFAPQFAPAGFNEAVQPLDRLLTSTVGAEHAGLSWLVVAAGVTTVAVPLLVLFEFARKISADDRKVVDAKPKRRSKTKATSEPAPSNDAPAADNGRGEPVSVPARRGRTVLECLR